MTGKIKELSRYSVKDIEKICLIEDVLEDFPDEKRLRLSALKPNYSRILAPRLELSMEDVSVDESSKYCPKCHKKYPAFENICMDCLVHLKHVEDKVNVCEIEFNPQFAFTATDSLDSFEEIFTDDNIKKINQFDFTHDDYLNVLHSIKSQAFRNFDEMVKSNKLIFDELDILEKIIVFVKAFVRVDYKSSGAQLGYFENNTIFIDDRQTRSLQITTLIHELSHFIIQEILSQIICRILDTSKNSMIEAVSAFILSYSPFTQLIDEYCAHNVEGRFTVFGFQDYSSFLQIQEDLNGEMSRDEVEITKSIGNTFALSIKEILESLIDSQLREDIKDQFLDDVVDRPNYMALRMENCQILNEIGLVKSLWLILNDGFEAASLNIEKLSSYENK